ncbi:MAG: hypothetical protein Ct9H300mP6_06620 [Gammaproteobacteria bacterium]|nr:MAG: hypothetical protein Ct9H300mP6_06620 [Gammaproteobacteria bacterium]
MGFGFFFGDQSCLDSLNEIVSAGQGFSLPSPQYIATPDPSVPNGLLLGHTHLQDVTVLSIR